VQAVVVLQNAPGGMLTLPGVGTAEYPLEREAALTDLTLEFEERDGALLCLVEYSTALFDQAHRGAARRAPGRAAGRVVADPTRPVLELPLLTDAEHRRLGHGFAMPMPMPMPTPMPT
jgi:hypothetical protein